MNIPGTISHIIGINSSSIAEITRPATRVRIPTAKRQNPKIFNFFDDFINKPVFLIY
jgi:hypothetical protein